MATPRTVGPKPNQRVPAGLARNDVFVIEIANLSDRRITLFADGSHFTGGQLQLNVVAVLGHDLGVPSGRADDLAAFSVS